MHVGVDTYRLFAATPAAGEGACAVHLSQHSAGPCTVDTASSADMLDYVTWRVLMHPPPTVILQFRVPAREEGRRMK
jgi:hypothetical protein